MEANPKVVGAMGAQGRPSLVVVVLVLAVVVDAGSWMSWVVVEIVLVVAVWDRRLRRRKRDRAVGTQSFDRRVRSRNACASFRAMRLSEPNSTWYVPPLRITRRRHALVTGFGERR